MVKKIALCLALLLIALPALGEMTVGEQTGECYFPDEKNWTYHFTYSYPLLAGEDYATAAINDTYQMALDEMVQLVLPMFANAESERYDGQNEVRHAFRVTCNNGRVLSILQERSRTMGDKGPNLTVESLTFDVAGDYLGQSLTLRGVILAKASEAIDAMTAQDYPAFGKIIDGSSDRIAEKVLPVLYEQFLALQQAGVVRPDADREDYELAFEPTQCFFADEQGNIVFFFPPELMARPAFDVPTFSFTPEELNDLL